MFDITRVEVAAVDWFTGKILRISDTHWIDECRCAEGEEERTKRELRESPEEGRSQKDVK